MDCAKLKTELAKINARFGMDCLRIFAESDQAGLVRAIMREDRPIATACYERFLIKSRVNLRMEQEQAAAEFGTINI